MVKYKNARKYLLEAINEGEKFFEAMNALGEVAAMELEHEEALRHFDKSLEFAPNYPDALWNRAQALLALGKNKEAVEVFDQLMSADPDSSETWAAYKGIVEETLRKPDWPQTYIAETKYYRVITGVSQDYADNLGKCLEQIRDLYDHYFPIDIKRVSRKYEVIVYRSKGEYHRYGGPQGAGGHYSPVVRRLFLFKYDKLADTLLVLNHEGFHQYLHEYGNNMPQWFNEGLGDFFGGALIAPPGSKAKMDGNHWRVDLIKRAIQVQACPTAEELMNMSREEMYGRNAGIHYAQAWAIVYYCIVGGKGKYQNALKNYFNALRKGINQRDAYRKSFGRLDMTRFERDWRNYIDGLDSSKEIELRRQKVAGDI